MASEAVATSRSTRKLLLRWALGAALVVVASTAYIALTTPVDPFDKLQGLPILDEGAGLQASYGKGQYRFEHERTVDSDMPTVRNKVSQEMCAGKAWHFDNRTEEYVGFFDHYTYEVRLGPGVSGRGVTIYESREATKRELLLKAIKDVLHLN